MHLIDTNIAIHRRDGQREITNRVNNLPQRPAISLMTRVELEGGVYRDSTSPKCGELLSTR